MEELLKMIKTRVAALQKAIDKASQDNIECPEGRLRVSSDPHRNRYYHITRPGDNVGDYITAKNLGIASALAQKEYNRDFLKVAHDELSWLIKAYSHLSSRNVDLAYQKLPAARKCLISPYILTDELYGQMWQTKPFKTNSYMPENKIYATKRGETVRSKSEAILADMFYEIGIPYNYEKALRLKSGKTIYPDFTLLKMSSREEIYLEHFGLLDNAEYLNASLFKLQEYRQSGIYPGKNLLFTYETAMLPLDIKGIRKMIKELLL